MNTQRAFRYTIDEHSIAWLTFDLPGESINKFNAGALSDLDAALDDLADNTQVKAVVITSGKDGSFIVGADINELAAITGPDDAEEKAREGHWVFGKLARLAVPTVAVIHGPCLGGGLEMALACDYRLVTEHPKTSLGLPEVQLGIIPGWGGTQRLPKLVGLINAMPLILTGKPVAARKALKIGLADGVVVMPFLEEQTRRFLESVATRAGRAKVRERRRRHRSRIGRLLTATSLGRSIIYRKARRQVHERTKGNYPAPLAAINVLQRTHRRCGLLKGRAIEIEAFQELVCSPISRNLVWMFQASQRLKKQSRPAPRDQLSIQNTAVVGAGVMGSGIAWAVSNAGLPVRLKDIDWNALTRGMAAAAGKYRRRVKRRRMTEGEMNLAMHRITPCIDYRGFANLDVVIEAVIENFPLKQRVLAEIEANVRPSTVICTNTSSLPLSDLADTLEHPSRFVGLHFFNPVDRMPLVEVVPGTATSESALVAAVELVRRMNKIPIVVADCPGFLVNRILLPYLVESACMFGEGVPTERIDQLLEQFGMPMGPLALVDEVGLDVGYEVAKVLEQAYGERMKVPPALGAVAECRDLLGKKNGHGFYLYRNGHKKPNPQATALGRSYFSPVVASLDDQAVVDRAVLIMINEAARCLAEGVVDSAESLDMAMVMGTGFAPFRGGLLRYADQRGIVQIKQRLEELAAIYGERFAPAPLIEQIALSGGHFYHQQAA